jgi:hypothetical protein
VTVFGILVGAVGMLFLVVAGISALSGLEDRWRDRRYGRLPQVAAGAGTPGGAAVVRGVTAAGPAGLWHAPLSGETCVWWQVRVVQEDPVGRSIRRLTRAELDSGAPVVLAGPEGTTLVDGRLALPTGAGLNPLERGVARLAVSERVHRGDGDGPLERLTAAGLVPPGTFVRRHRQRVFEVYEWVVPAGLGVTAVGRWAAAAPPGAAGPVLRRGPFVVAGMCPETPEQLGLSLTGATADSWWMTRVALVIGLLLTALRWVVLTWIAPL